ncbi:DUF6766 family protein [Frankia sp. CcWB3]
MMERKIATQDDRYNVDQLEQHAATVSWLGYVTSADFWNRTFQTSTGQRRGRQRR